MKKIWWIILGIIILIAIGFISYNLNQKRVSYSPDNLTCGCNCPSGYHADATSSTSCYYPVCSGICTCKRNKSFTGFLEDPFNRRPTAPGECAPTNLPR